MRRETQNIGSKARCEKEKGIGRRVAALLRRPASNLRRTRNLLRRKQYRLREPSSFSLSLSLSLSLSRESSQHRRRKDRGQTRAKRGEPGKQGERTFLLSLRTDQTNSWGSARPLRFQAREGYGIKYFSVWISSDREINLRRWLY